MMTLLSHFFDVWNFNESVSVVFFTYFLSFSSYLLVVCFPTSFVHEPSFPLMNAHERCPFQNTLSHAPLWLLFFLLVKWSSLAVVWSCPLIFVPSPWWPTIGPSRAMMQVRPCIYHSYPSQIWHFQIWIRVTFLLVAQPRPLVASWRWALYLRVW